MIWLIGNRGMLGSERARLFDGQHIEYVGTGRELDIRDRAALFDFAKKKTFEWIINCAAYTAVDKAEDDAQNCRLINTVGPHHIAETAATIGAKLIHISTDYVFNGMSKRPYREDDMTDPIGVYGLTKRDGEIAVINNNNASYIIRTSWLYGQYGNNFVHTMLRLMRERETVSVVNDQMGVPTWTNDLAQAIIFFVKKTNDGSEAPYGIYHFSGENLSNDNGISWFDFASMIYRYGSEMGILTKKCNVLPCTSAEYPSKVRRPAFSVLDKTKIKSALNIDIPAWDTSLKEFLKQMNKKSPRQATGY
jgi:dTDP-4-dehydrorhamnose reductase